MAIQLLTTKHGYVLTITQIPGEHEEEVPDNVIKNVLQKKNVVRKLSGNGDFRSQECIEYLKKNVISVVQIHRLVYFQNYFLCW